MVFLSHISSSLGWGLKEIVHQKTKTLSYIRLSSHKAFVHLLNTNEDKIFLMKSEPSVPPYTPIKLAL